MAGSKGFGYTERHYTPPIYYNPSRYLARHQTPGFFVRYCVMSTKLVEYCTRNTFWVKLGDNYRENMAKIAYSVYWNRLIGAVVCWL